MTRKPRVVIVGAGFGGLYAAKALKRLPAEVLLVDQHNFHTFQPLLYQVATAQIDMDQVVHSVRATFQHQHNFNFRQGTVAGAELDKKVLTLADGNTLDYDYLILAAGAVYNDFGVPGVRKYSFFLKSLSEAVNIRSHILRQFELADANPQLIDEGILNFAIVGGGPTGVEMAGAMVELFDRVLPRDFPRLDTARARIIMIEMTDALMLPYSEVSRRYTERVLRERGVDVQLGTTVAEVREHEVVLKGGKVIPTRTLIWAAGIRGSPVAEAMGLELGRGFRVKVNQDLSVPHHPELFVVGDMSGATDDEGNPYPQVAQVAIQQGEHAAKQVRRLLMGDTAKPFSYFDKGIMAIIGRNAGVAELSKVFFGLRFRGTPGWLAWLFIHLVYLVGHQNRFNVLSNWMYSYVTFDRHARLITDMTPSPAEITDKTGKLVSEAKLAGEREAKVQT